MPREGFTMQLKPGCLAEYRRRHDEIWPDLVQIHTDAGIRDFTIYVDPETLTLFATREIDDPARVGRMADDPVVRKWWRHNVDLMDCHPDAAPVCRPLTEVFHMD